MQTIKIRVLQFIAGMLFLVILGLLAHTAIAESLPAKPRMYVVKAKVTAYCPCKICCGPQAHGRTSTGRNAYRTAGVAVDPKMIPYFSIVTIPGVGDRVVDDTGGAMRQSAEDGVFHIDVRMRTHKQALAFGVQRKEVIVHEPQG